MAVFIGFYARKIFQSPGLPERTGKRSFGEFPEWIERKPFETSSLQKPARFRAFCASIADGAELLKSPFPRS